MTEVVAQSGEAHHDCQPPSNSLLIYCRRSEPNAALAQEITPDAAVLTVRQRGFEHPAHDVEVAEGMNESRLDGRGIDEVRRAQLLDTTLTLEQIRIDDRADCFVELDVAPERIPHHATGHESRFWSSSGHLNR